MSPTSRGLPIARLVWTAISRPVAGPLSEAASIAKLTRPYSNTLAGPQSQSTIILQDATKNYNLKASCVATTGAQATGRFARRIESGQNVVNHRYAVVAREAWHQNSAPRIRWASTEADSKRASSSSSTEVGGHKPKDDTSHAPVGSKTEEHDNITDQVSKYLHLPPLPHMPKIPPRPTKEDFLNATTGFWKRLKVRFKWLTIRSMRPWNADEWGAFIGAFLMGHLLWVLVGTTTFMSLLIFTANTVFAQETLARWVGDYLTNAAGVTVVFESAIVPKWKDGVITFHNVFVSRRPGQLQSSVTKGSSADAAAAAAAAHAEHEMQNGTDDGNYTQYDVTINEVNVTLSFAKYWNGKGPLKDVEVKGVRGVVDRTSVHWVPDGRSPLSYRHEARPGDFEIEHFRLEDLLLTIHQPRGFRPFSVSVYSCELPQLRKQYLFYDLLCATHMSGSYDGSLFTIHPKQIHGIPAGDERNANDNLGMPQAWKKFSRLRIDGLKIDHLNRGVEGTFGWIHEGNVDIVADVMIPADPDESLSKLMSDFYDKMEDAVTSNRYLKILDQDLRKDGHAFFTNLHAPDPDLPQQTSGHMSFLDISQSEVEEPVLSDPHHTQIRTPSSTATSSPHSDSYQDDDDESDASTTTTTTTKKSSKPPTEEDIPPSYLVMDLRIHLNSVRAAVPVFHTAPGLSYINQTLIRPIVAYINAKHTYIPISCRIVKRSTDFDGSWSIYDCGLMDDLSAEVYAAFARDVEDQGYRVKRLKKVGFWAFGVALQALLVGVAGDLLS